jgi:hypothetical protein
LDAASQSEQQNCETAGIEHGGESSKKGCSFFTEHVSCRCSRSLNRALAVAQTISIWRIAHRDCAMRIDCASENENGQRLATLPARSRGDQIR